MKPNARKRKLLLTDDWKAKIQASQIINRLQKCFNGELELSTNQIKIADILLKKTVPDLSRATIEGGDPDKPIKHDVNVNFVAAKPSEDANG